MFMFISCLFCVYIYKMYILCLCLQDIFNVYKLFHHCVDMVLTLKEITVMTVDPTATFPLQISCHLLVTSGKHDPPSSSKGTAPVPSTNSLPPSTASPPTVVAPIHL